MLLSALFVRYRDVEPIWDVTLQIMFYASNDLLPDRPAAEGRLQMARPRADGQPAGDDPPRAAPRDDLAALALGPRGDRPALAAAYPDRRDRARHRAGLRGVLTRG